MIMTVSFHFREPFIPDVIVLISFIIFLVGGIFVKKDSELKRASLLIMGSIIAILWYLIDFFIPGIYLPLVPSPEDLEFTRIYGAIFTGYIPDIVLILSLGILPLVVFFSNRSSKSIFILALGAIIQIVSILISIDPNDPLLSVLSLTLTAISMACYVYYSYQIKNLLLILFAASFFVGRLLYLLMI